MASTALARTSSVSRLAEAAQRYKNQAVNQRRRQREAGEVLMTTGENFFGAAMGGLIDALAGEGTGEAEVMGVPVVPVVAGLGVVAGLAGPRIVPGAKHIGATSVGMGCYWLGNLVRDTVDESIG